MEAYLMNSSYPQDHYSLSPFKHQIKNPRSKFNHPIISNPSENLFAPLNSQGGLLQAPSPPPFLSHSFPPPVLSAQYHRHLHRQPPPLPPLLPLPLPVPVQQNHINLSSRARGISCPPVNRKIKNKNTTNRDHQSPTPRKPSKPSKPATTGVVASNKLVEMVKETVGTATNGLGPDPKDPPRVLLSNKDENIVVANQVDKFSGSVVLTLVSPPPSSLPLPTFSTRPKLSCNVEAAAGVDAGATDSLCRLLRLR